MIAANQVNVGSVATLLGTLPAGEGMATVTNGGTAQIYTGTGTVVTTLTGSPLASGQASTFTNYRSSGPATLYAITSSGSAYVGVVITTPR